EPRQGPTKKDYGGRVHPARNKKKASRQHPKNETGDHILNSAKARPKKCNTRRNKNPNRRRIRKSMRRHLEKFNGKNSYYSRSDAFHGCYNPPQLSDTLEYWKNRQRDDERRQENRRGRERRTSQTRNFIAHVCCNDYHWARSKLTECKPVNELLMCEPVILINRLLLNQRDDRQAAPECQCSDLRKERGNLREAS